MRLPYKDELAAARQSESFLRLNVNIFIPSLTWITGQEVGREITWVQDEFISDLASFNTDVQTYLLQGFVSFAGGETRNIATQLVLQQCCKKKLHIFCCPFLPYLLIFCRWRRRLTLHNFILLFFKSKLQLY